MKKLFLFCFLAALGLNAGSKPLPVALHQPIIIDTDCAIDDMRAISLLLSRPEITIKAILISDGSLTPVAGYEKVRALLHAFNRDTIPVGIGAELPGINPPWREFNNKLSWGPNSVPADHLPDAVKLLEDQINRADGKITLVCLGALSNIKQLVVQNRSMLYKIDRIIWYNESVKPLQGFNYSCDPEAANFLMQSGLRMDVISNLQQEEAVLDTSFLTICRHSNQLLSGALYYVHSQPAAIEKLMQHHFRLCDDLVVMYLTNPELFDMNVLLSNIKIRYNQGYNVKAVQEVFRDMIMDTYVAGTSVVFNEFPRNREMFTYDVRQIMDSAIMRYGLEEWKANVMTDEFHGHLGVFSIVGAKMGIRAREIFHVGPDELEVTTFAGTRPPYSCMNDGIQVSTGATLGMGTIHVADDNITRPSAIFTLGKHAVRLTLKAQYLKQVNDDINEGLVKFGLADDGYWKLVRLNALKYWLKWDRNEIFDIEEISN